MQTISSDKRNETKWTARTGWALQAIILAFAPWMLICLSLPATRDLAYSRIVDDSVAMVIPYHLSIQSRIFTPKDKGFTRRRNRSVIDRHHTKGLAFEENNTAPNTDCTNHEMPSERKKEYMLVPKNTVHYKQTCNPFCSLSRNNRAKQITKTPNAVQSPKSPQ